MRILGKNWNIIEAIESTPTGDIFSVMLKVGSGAAVAKELKGISTLKLNAPDNLEFSYCARLDSICYERSSTYLIYDCSCERTLGADIEYQPLPFDQGFPIIQQIARGLIELHSANIVHGRLAPDTCLIASDGSVKLSEYGIKELWDEVTSSELPYIDPKLSSLGQRSIQSDIYAFGVLLYKMATGALPFEVSTITELKQRAAYLPPPSGKRATNWPPQCFSIVERCTSLDLSQRITSTTELMNQVQRLNGSTFGSRSAPVQAVKARKRKHTGINFVHRSTTGRASLISRLMYSPLLWILFVVGVAVAVMGPKDTLSTITENLTTLFGSSPSAQLKLAELLPVGVYRGQIRLADSTSEITIERANTVASIRVGNCVSTQLDLDTGYFACGNDDAFLDISRSSQSDQIDGSKIEGNRIKGIRIEGTVTLRGKSHGFVATAHDGR